MPVLVPLAGFSQQVEEFAKQLAHLAEVVEVGDDRGDPVRAISFFTETLDPADATTTTFDYREEFRRTRQGWLRLGYWYELRRSRPRPTAFRGRRGHHQHAPWNIHQHCETPTSPDDHYADVERLLQATHELFVQHYASGSSINCAGLVSLPRP